MPPRARTISDVWAKVDKTTTPDGCWPFTAADTRVRYRGARYTAAQIVLENHVGDRVRPGIKVRPTCGTRRCVRPEHLTTVAS